MPKLTLSEFQSRHTQAISICAIHPVVPKPVLDALKRDGFVLSPPNLVLVDALENCVHGDWTIRSERIEGTVPIRSYRKSRAARFKGSIILLADRQDVARVRATIAPVTPRRDSTSSVDCERVLDLDYDRAAYLQAALQLARRKGP